MSDVISFIKRAIGRKKKKKNLPGLSDKYILENFSEVKRVKKPWGFELWLSDATDAPYAFKLLYLKKGTKTSLQYHKKKVEHMFLMEGKIRAHYKDEKDNEVKSFLVTRGQLLTVKPPAIHRVEAVSDVLLVEASSKHLDDVVRVDDDYSRPDGKIKKEHG